MLDVGCVEGITVELMRRIELRAMVELDGMSWDEGDYIEQPRRGSRDWTF